MRSAPYGYFCIAEGFNYKTTSPNIPRRLLFAILYSANIMLEKSSMENNAETCTTKAFSD